MDATGIVEVPQKVQEAMADVLNAQFNLGRMASQLGERSITRKNCMPMNNALKALVQEIKAALDTAQTDAYAEGRADERLSTVLACIDIVAMHGGSVEIEAAMRALLDCEHDFKHDAERLLCGAAPVTEGDVIALAVAHNLGRTMKPIGMQTGDVFVTDQSYRTGELLAFAAAVADAERKRCAQIARNGCLVPPDGGSPTEDEAALCEEIARRIREVV